MVESRFAPEGFLVLFCPSKKDGAGRAAKPILNTTSPGDTTVGGVYGGSNILLHSLHVGITARDSAPLHPGLFDIESIPAGFYPCEIQTSGIE